ncbi:hypothetical protein [Chelativorans xinjiangense]|nr:hypothetical protein [Chelativorans xinjiangense]
MTRTFPWMAAAVRAAAKKGAQFARFYRFPASKQVNFCCASMLFD